MTESGPTGLLFFFITCLLRPLRFQRGAAGAIQLIGILLVSLCGLPWHPARRREHRAQMVAVLTQASYYPCLKPFSLAPCYILVIVLVRRSSNTLRVRLQRVYCAVLAPSHHHLQVSALLGMLLASIRHRHVLRVLHITGCFSLKPPTPDSFGNICPSIRAFVVFVPRTVSALDAC